MKKFVLVLILIIAVIYGVKFFYNKLKEEAEDKKETSESYAVGGMSHQIQRFNDIKEDYNKKVRSAVKRAKDAIEGQK